METIMTAACCTNTDTFQKVYHKQLKGKASRITSFEQVVMDSFQLNKLSKRVSAWLNLLSMSWQVSFLVTIAFKSHVYGNDRATENE